MEHETGIRDAANVPDEREAREELYTRVVRAGKRTYFFDVKATKNEDFYLTITESKKRVGKEGKVFYEKHKIFLYKEDFIKFIEGLKDVIDFIETGKAMDAASERFSSDMARDETETREVEEFINVEFDDLG